MTEMIGMGHYLRSAPMEYISLIMQEHLAHDCVERLGELGVVQFTDLNGDLTAFKRYYTPIIKRCDDLEKKLKFFEDEMAVYGIIPEQYTQEEFKRWAALQQETIAREHRGLTPLDFWETVINERHEDYQAMKAERDKTAAALYQAVQRRFVIEKASDFFLLESTSGMGAAESDVPRRAGVAAAADESERGKSRARDDADDIHFKHLAGIISTEDKSRFARIVFRASSGHAVVRFSDIARPLVDEAGAEHVKSVFAIFYRGRTLTPKLDRICSAFSAHQHDIPNFANAAGVTAAMGECKNVIDSAITWLEEERSTTVATLRHLALLVRKWRIGVQRDKATHFTLNMFTRSPERGTVTSQAWVLATEVGLVKDTIQDVHLNAAQGGRAQPYYFEVLRAGVPQPPTHFNTNKLTRVFQAIVNTYGVPRYGEANPALFSIATFPFLFGVMYGDIGHAIILTVFSFLLIYKEADFNKRKLGEIFSMCFKGRYMLFMMGLCSVYCGMIYNDFFSIGTSAFGGSRWAYPVNANGTAANEAVLTVSAIDIYPFGVDPAWHNASNELLFFNSMKMKLSVILGVAQMIFGLCLKISNALHFKSSLDLWFEAIPQMVFMVALFGYMVFLIIFKWCIDWRSPSAPGAPPNLIDTLINIILKPGTLQDAMFPGQATLQVVILLIVFFSVPIMLLAKPLIIRSRNKAKAHEEERALVSAEAVDAGALNPAAGVTSSTEDAGAASSSHDHAPSAAAGGHDPHSFGEVFIHQAIETIEFVLGSVSNTASYLRLWALSLAHSQLSTVFWERAIVTTIEMNSPIFVFIGFAVWAGITFGVLLLMDVLECFLHALRLHWVEFQNKFYKADGYKFTPFSFNELAMATSMS